MSLAQAYRARHRSLGIVPPNVAAGVRTRVAAIVTPPEVPLATAPNNPSHYGATAGQLAALDGALQRHVAQAGSTLSSHAAAKRALLDEGELRIEPGDDANKALAKAVARQCVLAVGPEKSAAATAPAAPRR